MLLTGRQSAGNIRILFINYKNTMLKPSNANELKSQKLPQEQAPKSIGEITNLRKKIGPKIACLLIASGILLNGCKKKETTPVVSTPYSDSLTTENSKKTSSIKENRTNGKTENNPSIKEPEKTTDFNEVLNGIKTLLKVVYEPDELLNIKDTKVQVESLKENILSLVKMVNPKITKENLLSYLKSKGFFLAIGLLPIEHNKFVVNAPFYKIKKAQDYKLDQFKMNGVDSTSSSATVYEVTQVINKDWREVYKRMVYQGMTITEVITGEQVVLLFPDEIEKRAKQLGVNVKDYRDSVLLNEASQVAFSKIIPPKIYSMPLNIVGIKAPNDWTVSHVLEAFSDWASLKYGNIAKQEIQRIIGSDTYAYKMSRDVLIAQIQLWLSKNKKGSKLSSIKSLNDEEFKDLRNFIIGGYEKNLSMILRHLVNIINSIKGQNK